MGSGIKAEAELGLHCWRGWAGACCLGNAKALELWKQVALGRRFVRVTGLCCSRTATLELAGEAR